MDGLLARLERGERPGRRRGVGHPAHAAAACPPGQPPEWIALEQAGGDRGGRAPVRRRRGRPRHHRHLRGHVLPPGAARARGREGARQPAGGRGGAAGGGRRGPSSRPRWARRASSSSPTATPRRRRCEEAFAEQIAVLVDAGADLICVETMSDLTEATRALQAAKAQAPGPPGHGDDDLRAHAAGLLHGDGRERREGGGRPRGGGRRRRGLELRHRDRGHGRDRPGADPRHPLPVVSSRTPASRRAASGPVVYDETPETMAARVPELLDLGVALIGGCCGTTPDHVRAIRNAVDAWRTRTRPA